MPEEGDYRPLLKDTKQEFATDTNKAEVTEGINAVTTEKMMESIKKMIEHLERMSSSGTYKIRRYTAC